MANLYASLSRDASQIRQHGKLFIGADKFAAIGTATLTRGGKGNFYWAVAASLTVNFVSSFGVILRSYINALPQYAPNINQDSADISLNSITPLYTVTGAALAAGTAGVSDAVFNASSATPMVTDLIAPGNVLFPVSANIVQAPVLAANPATLGLNPSELIAEVILTTAAGGATHFYGAIIDLNKSR